MSTPPLATFNTSSPVTYHKNHALTLSGLSLVHPGSSASSSLFHTADPISLQHGSVTGLVGVNGSGKTSLCRVLASKELPGFPESLAIEYLAASDDEERSDTSSSMTTLELNPVEYITMRIRRRSEDIASRIAELEARLETTASDTTTSDVEEIADRLSELYQLEEDVNERLQRELHTAVSELGLDRYASRYKLKQLSCGWRYKCRLVAAFLTHLDLLIVDEPSFLDASSTEWFVNRVEETARRDNAMILLVSHKESLLDRLCDAVWYINAGNKTLNMYRCGYRAFRDAHKERIEAAAKTVSETEARHQAADKSLKRLKADLALHEKNHRKNEAPIDRRFTRGKCLEAKQRADKSAASKLKRAKKRVDDLEEVRKNAATERVKPLHLDGTPGDGKIVSLQDVAVTYDGEDEPVFENVDVAVDALDRILLSGVNGVGKSTLCRLILGEMEASRGAVARSGNFIYFPQTALGDLLRYHGSETAVDYLEKELTQTQARCHLGNFGLAKDLSLREIRTLSAGQRVRLWLAKESLFHPSPSLLVVDEISENVDKETRDSLAKLLSEFQAAVLVISHDPDFRECFRPTKMWELRKHGLRETFVD